MSPGSHSECSDSVKFQAKTRWHTRTHQSPGRVFHQDNGTINRERDPQGIRKCSEQSEREISSLGATNCVLEGDAGTHPLSPANRPPGGMTVQRACVKVFLKPGLRAGLLLPSSKDKTVALTTQLTIYILSHPACPDGSKLQEFF